MWHAGSSVCKWLMNSRALQWQSCGSALTRGTCALTDLRAFYLQGGGIRQNGGALTLISSAVTSCTAVSVIIVAIGGSKRFKTLDSFEPNCHPTDPRNEPTKQPLID